MFHSKIPLVLVLSMTMLSACNAYPTGADAEKVDKSLLTSVPCEAPCWYKINIGETTVEEVRIILPTLDFIDNKSIDERNISKSEWTIYWESNIKQGGSGDIRFDESGKVVAIDLQLGYSLDLQTLIESIGEPDGAISFLDFKGEWFPSNAPFDADLVWLSKGISVRVTTRVCPCDWTSETPFGRDTAVQWVTYSGYMDNAEPEYRWNGYQPLHDN